MHYTIRQAVPFDRDFIYALFCQSVRPYVEPIWGWDEDFQQKDFDESFVPEQFGIIEVAGNFAGFVQVNATGDAADLCEIHLYPQFQRQGIGSAVIKTILTEFSVVQTGCFKANIRARALYERLGFRMTGETSTHYLFSWRKNHEN